MATTIIEQTSEKVKNNFFDNGRVIRLDRLTATNIMQESNAVAANILRVCGFKHLVSGNDCATINAAFEFYGVEHKYFYGVMSRYHINTRTAPDEVFKVTYSGGDRRNLEPGNTYLSARLILAMSAAMVFGRSIPRDSMVRKVWENLKATSYYENAEAMSRERSNAHWEERKAQEKAQQEAAALAQVTQTNSAQSFEMGHMVKIGTDGQVQIPLEVLVNIIVESVDRVLSRRNT